MLPFPTTLPTDEAMKLIVDSLRGAVIDKAQVALVAWNAVGYGLSLGFPATEGVKACDPGVCADMIEAHLAVGKGMKAFDWAILIPVLLDLIRQLFVKK